MHKAKSRTSSRRDVRPLACVVGLLLSTVGCSEEHEGQLPAILAAEEDGAAAAVADEGDSATPAAPAFTATVSATGSGCPDGAPKRVESADPSRFAFAFDGFDVEVDETQPHATKDCYLRIRLESPSGASFAVASYAHYGHARLEKGVEGKQTSTIYFHEARVTSRSRNTYLTGPHEGDHRSEPPLAESDAFWTPCAAAQNLVIVARVQLDARGSGAAGYASVGPSASDGPALDLQLSARPCTLPTPPAPR